MKVCVFSCVSEKKKRKIHVVHCTGQYDYEKRPVFYRSTARSQSHKRGVNRFSDRRIWPKKHADCGFST